MELFIDIKMDLILLFLTILFISKIVLEILGGFKTNRKI